MLRSTVFCTHEVIQFWASAKQYEFAVRDLMFSSVNGFINYAVKYFINKSVNSHTLNSANLLLEFLIVWDDLFQISNNVIYSSDDLQCLIEFIYIF